MRRHHYRDIDRIIRRHAGRGSIRQIILHTGIGPAVIEARAQRLGISLLPAAPRISADLFLRKRA